MPGERAKWVVRIAAVRTLNCFGKLLIFHVTKYDGSPHECLVALPATPREHSPALPTLSRSARSNRFKWSYRSPSSLGFFYWPSCSQFYMRRKQQKALSARSTSISTRRPDMR